MNPARRRLAIRLAGAVLVVGLLPFAVPAARAGEIRMVVDPRTLEQVVFPAAEVKIVTFEFASVGKDERGKERARELHRQLLSRIRDVSGGAVVTFVTPERNSLASMKVDAEKTAQKQHAQMALWGRVLTDKSGNSFINARLALIVPPRGIEASYGAEVQPRAGVPPLELRGKVRGLVTQRGLDFSTLGTDIAPLTVFLSGMMRYYRADRAASPRAAVPWLRNSIAEFERYARDTPEAGNTATVADALLYAARAHVRLADAEPKRKQWHLDGASANLERAARLNPYDPAIPTARAIVAIRRGVPLEQVRAHLTRSVSLAPADSDARMNLGLVESASGNLAGAVRQVDNARYVQQAQKGTDFVPAESVQRELKHYQVQASAR